MAESVHPTIPDYFSGKSIFITGITGFIGKVLVEKLLRSCPDIEKIYALIRTKKGKNMHERIKLMTDLPLFDVLKEKFPENLKKIVPISGDVNELDLGISLEDRKLLMERVHIVYHVAASVRFDDSLKDAIIMNTRGTREVMKLAQQMKNLHVLMHFSTTYCHTDKKIVEEKIYPAHADWKKCIQLAEVADPHILNVLSAKFIKPLPNTYTFTKSLAEHVVEDMCDGQVPAIIFRPSIVITTMTEPFSGWIDNFNGPVGMLIACGKGIVRSVYAKSDIKADYVPCDSIVKAVIIATWKKGTEKESREKYKVSVHNGSNYKVQFITISEMLKIGTKLCWEAPFNDILWYTNVSITSCWYEHYLKVLFYQLLPALFIDGLLILIGKKPFLVKIQRKIFSANCALAYYITNEWQFVNENTINLESLLSLSDFPAFNYETDHELVQPYPFFKMGLMGSRRYLLKEPDSTMEKAVRHSRRMWFIAQVFNVTFYLVPFYVAYQMIVGVRCPFNNF